MSNTEIIAKVVDQSLQLINLPSVISSGSEGVIQMRIELDDKWTGYGVTAVFYRTYTEVYHVAVTSDVAIVPHEVLANDGYFYFGLIGVSENTRTTEVVRVDVKQGAIKEATNVSEEPTPDIYDQILASYGVMEQRLNEVIAMRSSFGATTVPVSAEYVTGNIVTNGVAAVIRLEITDLSLIAGGHHRTDYCIPPELAPLTPSVDLVDSHADLDIYIQRDETTGWAQIVIENSSSDMFSSDMFVTAEGSYSLANISIAELSDLRVSAYGVVYDCAGEAVRKQLRNLTGGIQPARIGEVTLLANQWVGEASPYSQVVTIDGTTENSQVDLTPSVEQLAVFYEKDLTFVTENEDGVVTVYAIGQKPQNDYTIQVTITEVAYE